MTKHITLSLLFLLAILTFTSCEKDKGPFDLKTTDLTSVSNQDNSYAIEITSGGDWYVRSNDEWCWPSVSRGTGDATIQLNVEGNLTRAERSTIVTIASDGVSKEIKVTQKAGDGLEYHYKMPVVFHIIYQDPNDTKQNVRKGHMADLLTRVNALYKNSGADMNFEFVLAAIDPRGVALEEPGVERVKWDGAYPLDPFSVMRDGIAYKSLLWDPNKYINVLVYPFSDKGSSTLGIGHMPFTPKEYFLEGTSESPVSVITLADLGYAHCVSINSNYIYELSTDSKLNTNDASVTIAHELGHHMGLYHTFTQDPKVGNVDDCYDTDYCKDTPSYNRVKYEKWLSNYLGTTSITDINVAIKRTACDGSEFDARNIMDYYMCLNDRFTADQRTRVRHILTYGLMLPGPKIRATKLNVNTKGTPLDLPVRYME